MTVSLTTSPTLTCLTPAAATPSMGIKTVNTLPVKPYDPASNISFLELSKDRCIETLIFTYIDLTKQIRIEIIYQADQKLVAYLYDHQSGTEYPVSGPLPLHGLPKQVLSATTLQLQKFFKSTCLLIERDSVTKTCTGISVRISGPGGVQGKIPYQDGFTLGSTLKFDTLNEMEEYAKIMAQREHYAEQMRNADQKIQELQLQIQSLAPPKAENAPAKEKEAMQKIDAMQKIQDSQAQKIHELQQQIETLMAKQASSEDLIEEEGKNEKQDNIVTVDEDWETESKLEEIQIWRKFKAETFKEYRQLVLKRVPVFTGFQKGIASPIDFSQTKVTRMNRGFPTYQYSSQYISMNSSSSEMKKSLKQNSFTLGAGTGDLGWGPVTGSVEAKFAAKTLRRLEDIQTQKIAQGVLVINAFVTTGTVISLTNIHYDKDILQQINEAMKVDDPSLHAQFGISKSADDKKLLCILTEAVLGGSFTGLITVLDKSSAERHQDESDNSISAEAKASLNVNVGVVNIKPEASAGLNLQRQSEEDVLKNVSNTQVNIEYTSQGAVPTSARDLLEREVYEHYNPFSSADKDEGSDSKNSHKIIKEKQQQSIHSLNSLLAAYDSFAEKMSSSKDVGVPISLNYLTLTQERIQELLK